MSNKSWVEKQAEDDAFNETVFMALMNYILDRVPMGGRFGVFEIHPYSYSDLKEGEEEEPNFYYGPFDVSAIWYKHPGRSMEGDYENLTPKEMLEMCAKCMEAIDKVGHVDKLQEVGSTTEAFGGDDEND